MRLERVKTHFEEEANEFDIIIKKLIPHYDEMVDILVSMIPFSTLSQFSMIDLGCGTGTISKAVQEKFSNVDITCVDIAEKMLEIASVKLNGNISCIQADFDTFEFSGKFHLITSSLALHHLETDSDKLEFYKKIYSSLVDGGMFINIDVVLGCDSTTQNIYIEKWKEFMSKNVSEAEIMDKWIPKYYAEDQPTQLTTHLDMLRECGFSCIDVVYKYYNYAVYMAKK